MTAKVRFIGAGNIVQAILGGVEKGGVYANSEVGIFDVSEEVRNGFQEKGYTVYESIRSLVDKAPVVVVAVTPQVIDRIIAELKSALSEETVILSVAAGISTDWYKEHIGESVKAVSCMPNLTAQVGMGAFTVSRSSAVTAEDFEKVYDFLSSCGIVKEISESLMCEVVPLNGSSPAFFYRMAKVAVDAAVAMGFDQDTALQLFAQTMKGSAEMLMNSGSTPQELEDRLRLAGGTTLAALDKMDELGFNRAFDEGIKACVQRCRELSEA
ncbi:pyrroline-5-carboxylate reductase [Enterococcus sp. AZ135]|uniref:pyrroline-5-carboxylate reductase n=1 Tax=unclassified Enterococcus TaxID=2608891 RepID=UPI003F263A1A